YKTFFITFESECPVSDFLVPYGRTWNGSQSLSAGRPRTMTRPHLNGWRQFRVILYRPVHFVSTFFLGSGDSGSFFKQKPAYEIANKHKVSGEDHHGFICCRMIGEQKTDAFRGVSWCMDYFKREISHFDFIAVFQTFMGKFVLPVRAAFIGKIQLCSCNFCQFT